MTTDWENNQTHSDFAALERKVGRKSATPEERREYRSLRQSRRRWIGTKLKGQLKVLGKYVITQRKKP